MKQQRKDDEFEKHQKKLIVNILQTEMNLSFVFRVRSNFHKNRLRNALGALLRRNNQSQMQRVLQKTEKEIMNLNQYALNVRHEMINIVHQYTNSSIHK